MKKLLAFYGILLVLAGCTLRCEFEDEGTVYCYDEEGGYFVNGVSREGEGPVFGSSLEFDQYCKQSSGYLFYGDCENSENEF